MSNKVAFNSVVERAKRAEENRKDLLTSPTVVVPTSVIAYADMHINMLEDQLGEAQQVIARLRALVNSSKVG